MGISIEIDGVLNRLDSLKADVKNPGPPLRLAITQVSKFVSNNFATGGQGAGGWKALSDSRKARKKREGYDGGILVYKGDLRQKWGFIYGRNRVEYRSFTPYSTVHEFGAGHVPQRKILPTDSQAADIVRQAFDAWAKEITR